MFGNNPLQRWQKHVVFFTHQIECRYRDFFFLEIVEQWVKFVGELEPTDEFLLAKFAGLVDKEKSRLFVPLLGHDDPGKQTVQPQIGDEALHAIAQKDQAIGSKVQSGDGTTENHGTHPTRCNFADGANDDCSQRYSHEMRCLDPQVVEHFQNFAADVLEGIFQAILVVRGAGRFAVAPQIDHQDIEMLSELLGLFEPNRGAATGAMHEYNPFMLRTEFISPVM